MNCPTCGAANEADARFCAECGAPLESQTDQMIEEDEDRTILSSVSQISEEAKTVAVSQDDVADLAAEMEGVGEAEFESGEPPSPPPASPAGGGAGGNNTQRNIIIAVVVLLVLCCCCCVLAGIISSATGSIDIDDFTMIRDSSLPLLAFI